MYCRFTYLLTYLLAPWSRVLLEKLASLQLVKKFPAYCRFRRVKYEYGELVELHSQESPICLEKTMFQRQFFFTTNLTWSGPGSNPSFPGD